MNELEMGGGALWRIERTSTKNSSNVFIVNLPRRAPDADVCEEALHCAHAARLWLNNDTVTVEADAHAFLVLLQLLIDIAACVTRRLAANVFGLHTQAGALVAASAAFRPVAL